VAASLSECAEAMQPSPSSRVWFAFFSTALDDAFLVSLAFSLAANSCLTVRPNGIHVHLVRAGGITEYLCCVLPRGRMEDGYLYQ
jgi:hypothetical protein